MRMPRGSLFAPQTAFGEAAEQTAWFMGHGDCMVAEKRDWRGRKHRNFRMWRGISAVIHLNDRHLSESLFQFAPRIPNCGVASSSTFLSAVAVGGWWRVAGRPAPAYLDARKDEQQSHHGHPHIGERCCRWERAEILIKSESVPL
jgi:hypothetical protein